LTYRFWDELFWGILYFDLFFGRIPLGFGWNLLSDYLFWASPGSLLWRSQKPHPAGYQQQQSTQINAGERAPPSVVFSGPHGSTVDQPLHTAYTFKVSFEFYLFGSVRLRRLCVTFQGRTKSYLSICDDTSDSPHRPDANAALVPPEHHARWPLRELPPLVVSTWCVPLPKLEVCTPLSFIFAFVKRFVSFARFSPTVWCCFPHYPTPSSPCHHPRVRARA